MRKQARPTGEENYLHDRALPSGPGSMLLPYQRLHNIKDKKTKLYEG
jgi:hypothetical protein